MSVENGDVVNNDTLAGRRKELDSDGMTRLEREIGPNGALIAIAIYLTRDGASMKLSDVRQILNRRELSDEQVIEVLYQASFRRVTFQKAGLSDRMTPFDDDDGEDWIRPIGKENSTSWNFMKDAVEIQLDEGQIITLVTEHMNKRPSVNFGLGERSEYADLSLDDPRLHGNGVIERAEYNWPDWGIDDPTTAQ